MSRIDVYVDEKKTALKWKRVYIRKSLDEICHYIEVDLPFSERSKVKKHQHISVYYTNAAVSRNVTMGYIDAISINEDAQRQVYTVVARSAARDIVDSQWSGEIRNTTLYNIVYKLAKEFGTISLKDTVYIPTNTADPTKIVACFSWENESPWQKLVQEADNQGVIITSNQANGLYVWTVASGSRPEGFSLVEGQTVTNIRNDDNGTQQFYKYILKGPYGLETTGFDKTCPNNRILTLNLTDQNISLEQMKRRCETEIRRRRERRITVTCPGWGLSEAHLKSLGSLDKKEIFWECNFLTPVKLPGIGVDATLLTCQIEYFADEKTEHCDVQTVNREAYL